MLPWFLAYAGSPVGESLQTRTTVVVEAQALAIETLEIRRTAGLQARNGDRVTVRYRFWDEDRVLVDSERLGVDFTFTIGDGSVPDVFESGVLGLQERGYRKARVSPLALGSGFESRWPGLNKKVVFEVQVVAIQRPNTP